MKGIGLFTTIAFSTPSAILAQASPLCDDICVAVCESRLGACMTDAGLDAQKIAACIEDSNECQWETCACQKPITRAPLDNCFTGCRNWLFSCNGGDSMKTTSECNIGFTECQGECSMKYPGRLLDNSTAIEPDTNILNIREPNDHPTSEDDCRHDCLSSGHNFPNDLIKRTIALKTAPADPTITAFAGKPETQDECMKSCKERFDRCQKDQKDGECDPGLAVCRTACDGYPLSKPSLTRYPSQEYKRAKQWTWDGTTRGLRETGKPAFLVPQYFCDEENGLAPCSMYFLINTQCSNVHKGDWHIRNGKGDPKDWKSWKGFHGNNGNLDYCKFYPEDNCNGPYYTDCQGNCNLKNIHGKLQSLKCFWNTTVWPS